MKAPYERSRYLRPFGFLLVGVAWVLAAAFVLGRSDGTTLASRVNGALPGLGLGLVCLSAALLSLLVARRGRSWSVARTLELERAKDAAEHSDRVKTVFLSTVSHELRTPLNTILGFTDVLLQGLSGPLTADQQRQLRLVRDSSMHLRSLIEDVLDISRIEAGQVGLEFGDVNLYEVVSRRVEAFGPEYARKGLQLRVQVEGVLPFIRSDRKRTAQIVDNLLSNALKFTDSGDVTVQLRNLPDRLEMQVIDTGIGVPASAHENLFNPFTQVVRPGGRIREGTGLGLALSRNLARALGGDITFASEVGRGSRFALWLPLVTHEYAAASAAATFSKPDPARTLDTV
jgi:signal transduction histidine kinase